MIAGLTLNIFNYHAQRVRMANLAQVINVLQAVILTKEEKMILTPTYHVMEMYIVHQDAVQLPLKVTTQKYVFGKNTIDAVNASASRDKNRVMHISLVNVHGTNPQKVKLILIVVAIKT